MKSENLLLIFIKNPQPGKVKTRLAKSVGNKKACEIYQKLLNRTLEVCRGVRAVKQVWYSDFIDRQDNIESGLFEKHLQSGIGLGERMKYAFKTGFEQGYGKIVIIGSDCPDLSEEILETSFNALENRDVVIGPSEDGGYYLLGMKAWFPELFEGIHWSTEKVFPQTIRNLREWNLRFTTLPVFNDIDTIDDLKKSRLRKDETAG